MPPPRSPEDWEYMYCNMFRLRRVEELWHSTKVARCAPPLALLILIKGSRIVRADQTWRTTAPEYTSSGYLA